MSSSEEATVPLKYEIDSTLRAIIADVVDGDGHCTTFADLDGIVRVLGSVWFAELTYWSNGLNPHGVDGRQPRLGRATPARLNCTTAARRSNAPLAQAFSRARTSPSTGAFAGFARVDGARR